MYDVDDSNADDDESDDHVPEDVPPPAQGGCESSSPSSSSAASLASINSNPSLSTFSLDDEDSDTSPIQYEFSKEEAFPASVDDVVHVELAELC